MRLATIEDKAIVRQRISNRDYEPKGDASQGLSRFDEQRRLIEHFKRDVSEAYGILTYIHREALFSFAWDLGHASGLGDVLNYMHDVVTLALTLLTPPNNLR